MAHFDIVGTNLSLSKRDDLGNRFLRHIFPKGLLEHFRITAFLYLGNIADKTMFYEIQLEENNTILGDFNQHLYESKGFTK